MAAHFCLQAYVRRVFQSVDDGKLEDLKKLLSCKRYGDIRDRCGRTVLHRAILKQQENMVTFILEDFPDIINTRDSVSSCADPEGGYWVRSPPPPLKNQQKYRVS